MRPSSDVKMSVVKFALNLPRDHPQVELCSNSRLDGVSQSRSLVHYLAGLIEQLPALLCVNLCAELREQIYQPAGQAARGAQLVPDRLK